MVILYFILLFFVVLFELLRRRDFSVDFLSVFNFFFSLYYILVPVLFLLNSDSKWKYLSIYGEAANSLYLYLCIAISLVLVNFSYVLFNSKSKWFVRIRMTEKGYVRFVACGLFFGCFIIYLQSIGYGGLFEFLVSGYLNRAGIIDGGIFGYLTPFVKLIVPFFFIFCSLYFEYPSVKRLAILLISSIFFVGWSMSTGGRGALILTMLPIFFIYVNSKGVSTKSVAVGLALVVVGLSIIVFGRSFFYALALSNAGSGDFLSLFIENQSKYSESGINPFVAIFRHFDHSLVSAFLIVDDVGKYGGYRYIFDYPRVVLDALPGVSISRGDLDIINESIPTQLNKELIGLSGGYVPVGWVGLMLLNGGVFFLAVSASISGIIGAKVSSLITCAKVPGKSGVYVFFAFFWFWVFFHSDPLNLVIPVFSYYVFVLVFLCFLRFRRLRFFC